MASTITTPSPPTTVDVATSILGGMASQSGVVTDYNIGSQIRTNSESIGSVVELQGIISQAMAFQALVYSAYSAFGIFPIPAQYSVGTVTFATSFASNAPTVPQSVIIQAGTIIASVGGTRFQTTQSAILNAGSVSVNVPIQAATAGVNGNVAAGTITQVVTGLPYPLQVSNLLPTTGGLGAEPPAQTLARFTSAVAAIGLASPVSIANAVIGVTASGVGEIVQYSTVYEPWIGQVVSGSAYPASGYDVYIDNGSGAASSGLINAVIDKLNGVLNTNSIGYRPAGVPYNVYAVDAVGAQIVVAGTPIFSSQALYLDNSVQSVLEQYFNGIQFGDPVTLTDITGQVANATTGGVQSLSVALYTSGGIATSGISALAWQRIILQSLTVNF